MKLENLEQLYKIFTLREKCPNTEFFLVHIFPHSDWIRRDTPYLFVFSPYAEKYESEKTSYLDTFHAVIWSNLLQLKKWCLANNEIRINYQRKLWRSNAQSKKIQLAGYTFCIICKDIMFFPFFNSGFKHD